MKSKTVASILLVLFLAVGTMAYAAGPQEVLKARIDEFISILKDPGYKGATSKDAQNQKIWKIIEQTFDFEGITRRALGRNWTLFTPAQSKEMVSAFTDLLILNYLRQIEEGYTNETVSYLGEEMITDSKAVVQTQINRNNKSNIPVDYSLWNRTGTWTVYDVKVEGVSLIQNYRSQFDDILSRNSPVDLIQQVKDKVAELRKSDSGKK